MCNYSAIAFNILKETEDASREKDGLYGYGKMAQHLPLSLAGRSSTPQSHTKTHIIEGESWL